MKKFLNSLLCIGFLSLSTTASANYYAYVPDNAQNSKFSIVNTSKKYGLYEVTSLTTSGNSVAVAPSNDGTRVYVATRNGSGGTQGNAVYVIDTSNLKVTDTWDLDVDSPEAMALSPDDHWLLVATDLGYAVFDTQTGEANFPTANQGYQSYSAQAVQFTADGNYAVVARTDYGSSVSGLDVLDMTGADVGYKGAFATSMAIPAQGSLNKEAGSAGLAITSGDLIILANMNADTISLINLFQPDIAGGQVTLQSLATINLDAGLAPFGVALSPSEDVFYVTMSRFYDQWNSGNKGSVYVYDLNAGTTFLDHIHTISTSSSYSSSVTVKPKAIDVRDDGEIIVIQQVTGQQETGTYVSSNTRETNRDGQTTGYTETSHTMVSTRDTFINGPFVGPDCTTCINGLGSGSSDSRITAQPSALNPWVYLLLTVGLWGVRRRA